MERFVKWVWWAWKRVSDLSTLDWLLPSSAAGAAMILAWLQSLPFALLFVLSLGAGAFTLALVVAWREYRHGRGPIKGDTQPQSSAHAAFTIEAGEDIRFEEVTLRGHDHQVAKIGTPTSSPKGVHFGKVTSIRGEGRDSPENDRALIEQIGACLGGNLNVGLAWVETDGSAILAMQLQSLLRENGFSVNVVGQIPAPNSPLVKRLSLRDGTLIVDATK